MLPSCPRWGSPRCSAIIAGTKPPRPSVDSLPATTRSTSSSRTAAARVAAVSATSAPARLSSTMCTADAHPIASAFLSDSLTSPGAIITAITSADLSESAIVSATSRARSLISSITLSPPRSAQPVLRSSLRSPHVSGTCLMSTAIFMSHILPSGEWPESRIYYICAPGSATQSGVLLRTCERVAGYLCAAMRASTWLASCSPARRTCSTISARAISASRFVIASSSPLWS